MGSGARQSVAQMRAAVTRILLICGILLLTLVTLLADGLGNDLSIIVGTENTRTLSVAVRRPFLVKLPVQFGTGYGWTVTELPKNVVIVNKGVETPGSLQPGGEEYQVFKMKVEVPTNEHVVFSLRQTFEPQRKAIRTVRVNLIISES